MWSPLNKLYPVFCDTLGRGPIVYSMLLICHIYVGNLVLSGTLLVHVRKTTTCVCSMIFQGAKLFHP